MAESKKQSDATDVEEKDDGFAWLRYLIGFPSKKKERASASAPELQKRAQPDSPPPITTTPQAKPMELKKTTSAKAVVTPPPPQELPDTPNEPFTEEFPTWLRQDLNLNESIPPIEAPVLQEDNLSWLDGIASGLGAALDEPPTMNWEESEIMLTHNAAISSKKREGTELRSPKRANSADASIVEPTPLMEDDQSAPTIVAFEPSPSADDDLDIDQPTQHRIVQVSEAEELFASEIERLQDEQPTSPPTTIAEPRSFSLPPVEFLDEEDGTLISPPKTDINMKEIPTDPDEAMSWLENLANQKKSIVIPQLFDEDEGTHPTGEIPHIFDEIDDSFWRLPGIDEFDEDEGTYISAEPLLPQPVEDEKNFLLQGLDEDIDEFSPFYSELTTKKKEVTQDELEVELDDALLPASADDELSPPVETAPDKEPVANVEKPNLAKESIKEESNTAESASKLADFDEALAWLEGLSGETDSSLDEITLELDQENVAALLNGDRYPKTETTAKQLDKSSTSKPPVEGDLGEPTISLVGNGEPTIVSPADEPAPEKTTGRDDTTEKVESPKQSILPTPPTNRARRQLLEKSGEHHDALAWLEAFSAERSENQRERRPNVIVGRHITVDEPTVIHLFARERLFARDAVDIGNYGEAADVYQELIDLDNKDSADAVIAELSKVVETVTDYPRFYLLLGDAYQKATHFEQAAQSYRQAVLLLMPPKN